MKALSLFLAILTATPAIAAGPVGRWKLHVARGVDTDLAVGILSIEEKDGGWSGSLVARNTAMGKLTVGAVRLEKGVLTIALNMSDEEVTFEGRVTDDPYVILGTLGTRRQFSTAHLSPTEEDQIARESMRSKRDLPPPLKEFVKLEAERAELAKLLIKAFDDDRERLLREQDDHRATMDKEVPKLLAQAIAEHGNHPATYAAGLDLLANAYRSAPPADRVRTWATATLAAADRFGPRCRDQALIRAVDAVGRCKDCADLAIELARRADRELAASATAWDQERILRVLIESLTATGKADDAQPYRERLAEMESKAEAAFVAGVPKFTAKPFEKRKEKANRVCLFELFCGAQCPLSGSVSVACDRLVTMYKPTELILLQYHIHVPGSDALVCPDGLARWSYYHNAFPNATDIVPTSFFNGSPGAKGGAPLAQTRGKLDAYLRNINDVLTETTQLTMTLTATRKGDTIECKATVDNAGSDLRAVRLRMALVEPEVRYHGGNGVRVHRRIVRAMPGLPAGMSLKESDSKHTATINLAQLRKSILDGLDEHAKNYEPLPTPHRPLDLKNLKVVAWVQDDTERFIWQAIEADITEAK